MWGASVGSAHEHGKAEFSLLSCGCCPAWAAGRLPGAGHGVRGEDPSTPPAPPYSPLGGNAESVFFIGLYPVRRVSRGRRREPSPACGRGDVRACCGAPSALRASGIAFAPAPRCISGKGRKGGTLPGGSEGGKLANRRAAAFPLTFDPGDTVPPPRVLPFSKLKRSKKARWGKDGGHGGKETPLRASEGGFLPPGKQFKGRNRFCSRQKRFLPQTVINPKNLERYILRTSVYQAAACSIRALACPARACGSFT